MAEDELHHKIRLFCARTRMVDFFRPFDKLNLKRIPQETAVRAIDSSGLSLSKAEHDALAKLYVDEHGLFDYAQLVNDHNDVPPAGFYERNPAATAAGPVSRASSFSASPLEGGSAGLFVPLTDTERALLEDVLERVRHYVATRGIILKKGLRDFDEHKKGLVTVSRFTRELASVLPILRPAEADLVAKAYMTADRADVRYMVFHADATPGEEARPTGSRGVMGSSASAAAPPSPDRLKLNLGASTGSASGFGATGGSLGASMGRAASAEGGAGATASAPLNHTRQKPAPEKVLEYRTIPAGDIEAIEASVVRQTFERRLRLWDCFCDWDKKRLGEMPRALFRRGIAQARFDGLSPACVETLADKYAVATDPTLQTIRWIDFVDEVERAFVEHGLEKDPSKTNTSFAHSVVTAPHPRHVRPVLAPEAAAALEKALDETKHAIRRWRIFGLKAPLADYDRCGEGMVTETQFLRVLAMFNLVPSKPEGRTALLDYYRGKGAREHMIDYRAFLQEVMAGEEPAA